MMIDLGSVLFIILKRVVYDTTKSGSNTYSCHSPFGRTGNNRHTYSERRSHSSRKALTPGLSPSSEPSTQFCFCMLLGRTCRVYFNHIHRCPRIAYSNKDGLQWSLFLIVISKLSFISRNCLCRHKKIRATIFIHITLNVRSLCFQIDREPLFSSCGVKRQLRRVLTHSPVP